MEVEEWDIDKVKPYDKNPRNNDSAINATAKSIKAYGWQQPIVVDEHGVIIVGHTRLKAAKKLGLKKVPVTVAVGLTPEQVKGYRIADNKTGDLAVWDNKLLLGELEDLDGNVFTGFSESEIFDDVLDESDNSPVEENRDGVTYSLKFSTQDKATFDEVTEYIRKVSDLIA